VSVTLDLPVPPSANVYWRSWRGRVVRSPEADAYANLVLVRGRNAGAVKISRPRPVKLTLWWYRERASGDLSNRIKVLEDALQGVAYDNDAQVVELHAYRIDRKANPGVVVTVEAA